MATFRFASFGLLLESLKFHKSLVFTSMYFGTGNIIAISKVSIYCVSILSHIPYQEGLIFLCISPFESVSAMCSNKLVCIK